MLAGAPLPLSPLSPRIPVSFLLALTSRAEPLGAWVGSCRHPVWIYQLAQPAHRRALASCELGFLLRRCTRVVVRENRRLTVLPSEAVIQWRALQVATATPYLPGLERMQVLFPRLQATVGGFQVPLHAESAEEVLSQCVSEGVRVTGSRIVYSDSGGEGVLPEVARQP
jgi:hypothetical protein